MKFLSAAMAVLLAVGKIKAKSIVKNSEVSVPSIEQLPKIRAVRFDRAFGRQKVKRTMGFLNGSDRVFEWVKKNYDNRNPRRNYKRWFSEPEFRKFINDMIVE